VLVTFTGHGNLERYRRINDVPFRILVDRDRSAYRAFGLGRGSFRRVWGPRALAGYLRIIRSGGLRHLRRPSEDTLQLGGDFVVAPDGMLAWAFRGQGPDHRPSVDDLIAAVAALRA
jgi:hypothetical protein